MIAYAQTYEQWRATVPWTNEEIVRALREEAESASGNEFVASRISKHADYLAKTGRLRSRTLGFALGRLVRACQICGKKALYMVGNRGRCSEHRLVPDVYVERKRSMLAEKWAEKARVRKERDCADLDRRSHKTTALAGFRMGK